MEGLLLIAALFFLALPLVSFIMVLNANGRLKRTEQRIDQLSRLVYGETNRHEETIQRITLLEKRFETETPATPSGLDVSVPEKSVEEKISEPLPDEAPAEDDDPEVPAEPENIADEAGESMDRPEGSSDQDPTPELESAARETVGADAQASVADTPQTQKPKKAGLDLESLVGGRWSILLGGFALALGLVFLVQYSIESGLLGPGPRIILGALFSVALFGAGEWLRRSDRDFDLPVYEKADVPGILTGAGSIGAFATLYAAHALYGFVGPGLAFVGLTMVGIVTMLLSSIHGPKLAAIGVLGAYVAPLLVDSREPNAVALALHVVVVTAVVMSIARLRQWTWLAIAASIFSTLWIMLAAITTTPSAGLASAFMIIAITAIFVIAYGLHEFRQQEAGETSANWVTNFSFTLLTFGFIIQLIANEALPETTTALITAMLMMAGAVFAPSLATIAIHATVVTLITLLVSRLNYDLIPGMNTTDDFLRGIVPVDTVAFLQTAFLLGLTPTVLAIWGSWRSMNIRNRHAGWLASSAAAIAFFGLLFTYLRIAPFETRPLIGTVGMGLALALVLLTEAFSRRSGGNDEAPAPAAFAVGAVSCLSLSLAIGIDLGWLPLALSLTALGVAGVYIMRPLGTIPWLSLASGILAAIALWFNMPLEYPNVSTTLVFNGLIMLLGIPSLCLIFAGELMRFTQQGEVTIPSNALTAIGLAVFGLFIAVEVVHIVNSGDLVNARQSLAETSGHALASLFLAFGLRRLAKSTGETVFTYASLAASALSVVIIAFGLLLLFNPYYDARSVGTGIFLNLLLPGYLLTGLVAGAIALYSRDNAPRWYTLMYAGLSGVLLFAYASLMLRKTFQGPVLASWRPTSDLEFWMYSPLWLALGAIILAVGLRYNSIVIRAASGILIVLTILKVFLFDMAQLEGFLRAISFIGLGLSLIVVGRFYQRLLTRASNKGPQTPAPQS